MKSNEFTRVAITPKTSKKLSSVAKFTGMKIYVLVEEAINFYSKKIFSQNSDIEARKSAITKGGSK